MKRVVLIGHLLCYGFENARFQFITSIIFSIQNVFQK